VTSTKGACENTRLSAALRNRGPTLSASKAIPIVNFFSPAEVFERSHQTMARHYGTTCKELPKPGEGRPSAFISALLTYFLFLINAPPLQKGSDQIDN
jgi:hypothetical protein